jgi:hypothetical protein
MTVQKKDIQYHQTETINNYNINYARNVQIHMYGYKV